LLLFFCYNFTLAAQEQKVTGKWRHYDSETGQLNSIMETYIENGKLYARILELFVSNQPDTLVCVDCPDNWRNQKILGINIVNGLSYNGHEWEGENALLDPEVQKAYCCKVWRDGENLLVRGYLGFIYQTLVWYPFDENQPFSKSI